MNRDEAGERRGHHAAAGETFLVVGRGEFTRHQLKAALRDVGRDVFLAASAKEGLATVHDLRPDLILVGLELPDISGIRVVDLFRQEAPGVPVVAITERPTVEGAVEAIRHGAADYVAIPDDRERLPEVVERALTEARTSAQLQKVRQQVHDRYGFSHLLSQSPRMLRVFDQVRAVAHTDATVLIRGETGTGKELVSRAIHDRSRRKDRPFISVNCGAFTESLLESELFGHEKGSFTGAMARREGLFEMADSGSLFLDELGETSLSVQVNLLRVLEEMTFRRVGGRESVSVDVRIIAATNVQLERAVTEGRFRQDLFYRLNVFPIFLPALRERREDIPLLMRHFLDEISEEYGMEPPVVASEAMEAVLFYHWPGNVRQLRSMCERWVITRHGQRMEKEHLPPEMTGRPQDVADVGAFHVDEKLDLKQNLDRAGQQVERAYLYKVLHRCGGHLERTAREAGISRRTLYTKMKQHGLEAADFKKA
jgi:DNA-binding NtrC family response regulator